MNDSTRSSDRPLSLVVRREGEMRAGSMEAGAGEEVSFSTAGRLAEGVESQGGGGGGGANYLRIVKSSLRGRYVLVGILSAVAAAVCAAWGWHQVKPVYASEGLVRIAMTLPTVGDDPNADRSLPMFETFMLSQKTMITSRRVIDLANQQKAWAAMGVEAPVKDDQYYGDHLLVDIKPRSELIRLEVSDEDPRMAAAAVTAVIDAYAQEYQAQEQAMEKKRIGLLQEREVLLQSQMDDLTSRIRAEAEEYGTTNLDPFYDAVAARVMKIGAALDEIDLALAGAATRAAAQGAAPGTAPAPNAARTGINVEDMTPQQIGMVDAVMRSYIDNENRMQDKVAELLNRSPEGHPLVIAARKELATASARVDNYAQAWRDFHKATAQNLNDTNHLPVVTAGMSQEALQENKTSLARLLARDKLEMVTLGNKRLNLEQMQRDLKGVRDELTALSRRMEVLRADGAMGGRLNIINTGEVPLSPTKDLRRKVATMGGLAGAMVPVGLVVLGSLVRRRYRYVDEAKQDASLNNVPLLAMLPEVKGREEGEVMMATAHGIHQMRVLLCSRIAREAKQTYLLTSATQGEGKTSLTVALGMSYAASKRRTLLIDGDFVGRRLTQGFKAEAFEGTYESMQGGGIKDRVRAVSNNLDMLPAGRVKASSAWGMTTENMRTLLDEACAEYDTVLVDSGPILGSLEAAVLAQEVDGVIMLISRGQHPHIMDQAMRRLNSVGARLSGVVFNRAKLNDFNSSSYTSTSAVVPYETGRVPRILETERPLAEFGPLARAVVLASA